MAPRLQKHEYLLATMVQSDFEHFQMSGSIITWELFLSLTSCWLDITWVRFDSVRGLYLARHLVVSRSMMVVDHCAGHGRSVPQIWAWPDRNTGGGKLFRSWIGWRVFHGTARLLHRHHQGHVSWVKRRVTGPCAKKTVLFSAPEFSLFSKMNMRQKNCSLFCPKIFLFSKMNMR